VSAVPGEFPRGRGNRPPAESSGQAFRHWFALAVLVLAWIAEATLCAMRGF
jgi:hypothetical protein